MGGGGNKSQKITKKHKTKKTDRTRIVHTSGHFPKSVEIYLLNLFIYTENDTKSDKRIKNNNLYYKARQKYQNTFEFFELFRHEIEIK